jgi:hypothetical protein
MGLWAYASDNLIEPAIWPTTANVVVPACGLSTVVRIRCPDSVARPFRPPRMPLEQDPRP